MVFGAYYLTLIKDGMRGRAGFSATSTKYATPRRRDIELHAK